MLVAAVVYVMKYGSNVPSWDDWDMVPTLAGAQPVTIEWLWSQHNEHRIPVPRLVYLGANRVFGPDFRVGMYLNVAMMAVLAAGLMLLASRQRGGASFTDAFFPLILLGWGQGLNFIWGWQIEFFLSTVAAVAVLVVMLWSDRGLSRAGAAVAAVAVLVLAGSGAHGVALVPPVAVWLAAAAVLTWRRGGVHAQRDALVIAGVAITAAVVTALYFIGYEPVPYHPKNEGRWSILRTSVQFLTMSFGPAVRPVWPASGIAMLLLLMISAMVVVTTMYRRPDQRIRGFGLLCFLGAMAALGLGIGMSRDGFEPRYITLAVPVLCCVYYIWNLYGAGSASRATAASVRNADPTGLAMRTLLLLAALAAFWPNVQSGIAYGSDLRSRMIAFERDMIAGVPPYQLITRHATILHPHQDIIDEYLPMLREAGAGSFVHLRENPPLRVVRVPLEPIELHEVVWNSGHAQAKGHFPYVIFELPEEVHVAGIRLKYLHQNGHGTQPYVSIHWKRPDQIEFNYEQFSKYSPTGDRANWDRGTWTRIDDPYATMTVWIDAPVKQIRIHPDFQPASFEIIELVLLIPDRQTAPHPAE